MDATIVIPTKNAGVFFEKVLNMIFQQNTTFTYEVICVDSGSNDETLDIINKFDCILYQIQPSEFGHGKTRNFGASKGSGRYIVFITQDALPVNENWLHSFISAMEEHPTAQGSFGIHYPYPDCNIYDKNDIHGAFVRFGEENFLVWMQDKDKYLQDEGYRHYLCFFSDNNSCLRRTAWETTPYEDVDFAEDQIWARAMIESGEKTLYCPHAAVYHSHNYKLTTYFSRYYDEFKSIWNVHQYTIAPTKKKMVVNCISHIKREILYTRSLSELSKKNKYKWCLYCIARNIYRYIAGYLGGRYHTFSKKKQVRLDKKYSQQYKQINRGNTMSITKRFFNYLDKNGLKSTLNRIVKGKPPLPIPQPSFTPNHNQSNSVPAAVVPTIDIIGFYDFIIANDSIPFSITDFHKEKDRNIILNWVIPEPGVGSGGHQTIFRFVSYLEKNGIHNKIYLFKAPSLRSDDAFKEFTRAHFPTLDKNVELHWNCHDMSFAHGVVATAWYTAYFVSNFNNTISKFYFVQDFEPYFYPLGSEYQMAENTYKMGLRGITAGDWLKDICSKQYGMISESFGFSYDKNAYVIQERKEDRKRVLFYARPTTPRRDFELGLLSLNELFKRMPEVDIVFVGADLSAYVIPFPHTSTGILTVPELAYWQSQSDFCLVLSNTNLSLLPLEVMGSNSIAVCSKGENSTWLVNEANSILVDYEPTQIADTLVYYFNHPEKMDAIRQKGYEFANKTSWETEFERAKNAIVSGIAEDEIKITANL